jgi:hypothetical protein
VTDARNGGQTDRRQAAADLVQVDVSAPTVRRFDAVAPSTVAVASPASAARRSSTVAT